MDLMNALQWRYAVRRFTRERLEEHEVRALLEATALSASSWGLQPYRLLVIEDRDLRRRLVAHSFGQDKVAESSHLVVVAARTDIGDALVDEYVERLARARQAEPASLEGVASHIKGALAARSVADNLAWAHQQAHIALGTMLTAAALLGIDACPMGGFDADAYDEILGLAARNLTTSVICAIGRRHGQDHAARAPKVRRAYHEMVAVLP
jgi:nitroreductase/dihydropteridine reductase